jgi:hypothetical protein
MAVLNNVQANEHYFSLAPFSSPRLSSEMIEGTIVRSAGMLSLHYRLFGRFDNLLIPAPAAVPERRARLWKDTCFELFLTVRGAPSYWEFNLSPAGHWNVYRFTAYRQEMAEKRAFATLPFMIQTESLGLTLGLEIELDRILPAAPALEAGVSAVLKHADGTVTYWALAHRGPQPDFHRRNGFLINVPIGVPLPPACSTRGCQTS